MKLRFSAPGYATLQGDTIRTDVSSGEIEFEMLAVVLLTAVGAFGTHLLQRRRRKT